MKRRKDFEGFLFNKKKELQMTNTINLSSQKRIKMPVLIDSLIIILHNIQQKINSAAGAATALELRLRIIAQLELRIQDELGKKNKKTFL